MAALIAVILSSVQLVVVLLRARLGLLDGGERSVAQRANDPPDCEDLSAAHELHMTSTDAAESARLAFR